MATATMILALLLATEASFPKIMAVSPSGPIGSCVSDKGKSFDLRNLVFLESRSIIIIDNNKHFRINVLRERVEISQLGSRSNSPSYYTNIGYEVEPEDDLDIELKLGAFSGELVIYWKETYQNQIFRQGLFRIAEQRVQPLCQGKGGFDSSE